MKTRFYLAAAHLCLFAVMASGQVRLAEVPGKPGTFDDSTGVALSATTGIGFVSNPGSGLVQKFRVETGEILASVALPAGVGPMALTRDERTLVVLGVTAQRLYTIATGDMTVLHETSYPGTTFTKRSNIVISREGYYFYISDPSRDQVLVFVTRTGLFDRFIHVDRNPNLLSALPESSRIAVLCNGKVDADPESIWIFDSLLNTVVDNPVLEGAETEPFNNIQATPGGDYLFIGSYNNDRVFVYNVRSKNAGGFSSGGDGPAKIVASADGRYLAVVNVGSKSIALFDGIPYLANPRILEFTGFEPSSETTPVFSKDSHTLYIPAAGTNEIIAYDVGGHTTRKRILTAAKPTRLAISGDDTVLASLDTGGNVLSLIALEATPLYVPYLTQKAHEYTGLALANLGEETATVSLTARDNSGNLIAGTSNPKLITMAPGQQMSLAAGQVFGFATSAEIDGYVEAYTLGTAIRILYMAGNTEQTRLDGLMADSLTTKFPAFGRITEGVSQFGSPTKTEIVLENPSETDASLTIRLFGDIGAQKGTMLDFLDTTLKAHERLRKSVSQLMPAPPQHLEGGYLEVTSTVPIKGIEVVTIGDSIAFLPATMRDESRLKFDAVQFASGGAGVLETPIFSSLAITNMVGHPVKLTAEVLDAQGRIVPEGSSPVELELGQNQTITGGADKLLNFPDPLTDPALYSGTLHIEAEGEGLTANLLYGDARNGKYLSSASLVSEPGTRFALIHFAEGSFDPSSKDEYYTGIAMYNPSPGPVGVTVDVFAPDGTLIGRNGNIDLEAESRIAMTLGQIIRDLKRPSTGRITITSTRPIHVFEVFGSSHSELLVSVAPVVLSQ